ncbi:hypothetical protein I6E23_12155 [Prevotella brevis]|nr:hypothetical protein [Xylanibacter brevis]
MMNYSYFWSIDGEIRLPRPERTYFDDLSEEYKDASTDKKLLEIAYCIWHGLSLYDEVKTMLQEHTQVKEHTIKSCLLSYIEYLRSGDMKNKSYIILKDKLTLKQASDLLSEELMLRYRLPANGTDNHYLVTAHWDYNETQNKDYFKPTKVSAVPLTEQEIRDTNPWQSSYVRPNPSALYDPDAEWLLTCDEQIIKEFNQKNKNTDYKFMLGMRPEIFNGNPLKSKVVILSLNPGYVYRVNNLYARLLQMVQPIEEAVKQHKDNQLKLSASSFFCQRNQTNDGGMISYRDAHCAVDDWYWYDIFKEFRKKAGLPDENDMNDVIFNNVSLVQYVGYISKSWKSLHKLLPSQRFTRMLIHYLALNTDTLFVVSRSEKLWKRLIGDEIWEMLDNDKRLVHRKKFENKKGITQAIRTQGFTKASFEDGGFDRIADKFRT